jgi:putative ABC transport system permease protein
MSRHSRVRIPGILGRHYGSGPAASILVAVLIALVVFVVALAPRAISAVATAELRHHLDTLPPLARDIAGTAQLLPIPDPPTGQGESAATMFGAIDDAFDQIADLPAPLSTIAGEPDWYISMAAAVAPRVSDEVSATPEPRVALVIDLEWDSRVRFLDGDAPATWTGTAEPGLDGEPGEVPPLDIALSEDAAALMAVEVGDELEHPTAVLRVAGIYEPIDPDDPYWSHAVPLAEASLTTPTESVPSYAAASAYIAPNSAPALRRALAFALLQVWSPVDVSALDYADAATVAAQTQSLVANGINLPSGEPVRLFSQLQSAVEVVTVRVTALSALLALMSSGPLGVAVAVFALGAQSVIARRRPALALAAARGGSPSQLRLVMLIEGVLLAVPGAVVAIIAAGLVLPTRAGPEAVIVPALVALTVPALFAGTLSPGGLRSTRSDLSSRSRNRVRGVIEVSVIGLAALSVFLLARRGLVESSAAVGIDPLLAGVPLLLAGAACVLVLRGYPIPLRALERGMRSRRDAVGLLGAARAIRDPALGFPATLALVVGMSVAVFSAVMGTTVSTALGTTARETVGADIRVEAYDVGPDVQDLVAGVPGVAEVTPLAFTLAVDQDLVESLNAPTLVVVDTESLRVVNNDLPADLDALVGGAVPVVVSEAIADEISENPTIGGTSVVVVESLPSTTFPRAPRSWILVDSSFAADLGAADPVPELLLVTADPDAEVGSVADGVEAVVVDAQREPLRDNVRVADASTELADMRSAPLISGLEAALLLALLISATLCVLTVVVASVSAASRRNRTIGILRTLGMSPRQTLGLMAWEIGPVAITAAIAGAALGLVLPWIVTSTLDLRPFVGGFDAPTPDPDPLRIVIVVVGFLAIAALAGLLATAIGRRLHPAGILKMGAE